MKNQKNSKTHKSRKMEYKGYKFLGVKAYCFSKKENRVFRVDRILEANLM